MTVFIVKDKCKNSHIGGIFTTEEVAIRHAEKTNSVVEKWHVFETDEQFRYTKDGFYVVA